MNLFLVNARWKFRFHCRECGKMKWSDAKTHVDLDGPAFDAYVCGECIDDQHLATAPAGPPPVDLRTQLAPWEETDD